MKMLKEFLINIIFGVLLILSGITVWFVGKKTMMRWVNDSLLKDIQKKVNESNSN